MKIVICMVLATAMFIVVGCNSEHWGIEEQKNFELAQKAYKMGDNKAAVEFASKSLKNQPDRFSGDQALEALYLQGLAEYNLKRWAPAMKNLQYVVDHSDNVTLEIRAADTLGEVLFIKGRTNAAMNNFEKIVSLTESGQKPRDHAQFRSGCIYQRWGKWKEADLNFQRVIFHFPKSIYVSQCHARAGGRFWAIQAGVFPDKDKALAAAGKFKSIELRYSIRPVISGDNLEYHLLLGRYKTYDEAMKDLPETRKIDAGCELVTAK